MEFTQQGWVTWVRCNPILESRIYLTQLVNSLPKQLREKSRKRRKQEHGLGCRSWLKCPGVCCNYPSVALHWAGDGVTLPEAWDSVVLWLCGLTSMQGASWHHSSHSIPEGTELAGESQVWSKSCSWGPSGPFWGQSVMNCQLAAEVAFISAGPWVVASGPQPLRHCRSGVIPG